MLWRGRCGHWLFTAAGATAAALLVLLSIGNLMIKK